MRVAHVASSGFLNPRSQTRIVEAQARQRGTRGGPRAPTATHVDFVRVSTSTRFVRERTFAAVAQDGTGRPVRELNRDSLHCDELNSRCIRSMASESVALAERWHDRDEDRPGRRTESEATGLRIPEAVLTIRPH